MEFTQQDIKQIREQVVSMNTSFSNMDKKLDKMYGALMGNELTKEGGVIAMLKENERRIDGLENRIELAERRAIKSDLYVRILWLCAGFIAAAIIQLIIHK